MKAPIQVEALYVLIGRQFTWKDQCYTAIEILSHPPTLVAQNHQTDPHIQNDVHGRAHQMVERDIISIPILNAEGSQLHPDFLLIHNWVNPDQTT
jgi:hypothetical protein